MSNPVIKVQSLSKQYRLGNVGLGSLGADINRWYQTSLRGREDPYLKIGEENDRAIKGESEYVWALRDINFEVKQGEVLGIIGRNGAGKSTLLKILSRTTAPTTGQIKIKGRVASLLEVGTGFHPELTGRENIFLNGAILGMTKNEIKSKFDEIVDFAGVERYIDTPVKRYSSGMYVRLAFAVAAHLEPEILIVDEVLAVGDIEFQKKALGKLKDVSGKDGRTVLFVSHNMAAIQNLCNSAILLQNGEKFVEGNVNYVLEAYNKSVKSRSNVNLKNRKDRNGNGKLMITNFYVHTLNKEVSNTVKSGDNINLVLEYINNGYPDFFKETVASFALLDNNNQTILLLRSNFTNENFLVNGKYGKITCSINNLNLANGLYNVVAYLGFEDKEIYDLIENVGEIEVEGGDYFGTGINGLPSHCKILTMAKWDSESFY